MESNQKNIMQQKIQSILDNFLDQMFHCNSCGIPGGLPWGMVIEGRYVSRHWLPLLGIRELGTSTRRAK